MKTQKMLFSRAEINFIIKIISDDAVKDSFVDSGNNAKLKGDNVVVDFEKSQLESILNDLTENLVSSGFDQAGNINSFGAEIEDYIDKFSRAYYS